MSAAAVQEVILKLTADATQFGAGTATAKRELTVLEEAKKRLAAQDRADAVRRQMESLAPPSVPSVGGFGGVGGLARGIAGGIAVDAAISGTLTAMKDSSIAIKSTSSIFGDIASSAAESVPLFGNLVRSLKQIVSEGSGFPAISRSLAQFAEISRLRAGEQSARVGGADQFAFQFNSLQRGLGYSGASSQAAQSFLAGLTPDRLAAYRPRPFFGVANAASGDLQAALDQALANAGGARSAVGVAQAGVNEISGEVAKRRERLNTLQQQQDEAKRQAERAELIARDAEARGGFLNTGAAAVSRLRRSEQENRLRAAQSLGNEIGTAQNGFRSASEEAQRREVELRDKRTELAQREFEVSQARLAIEKNQLQLLQDRVGAMRGNATSLGLSGPGSVETLSEAYRIFKSRGIQALTPELRQLLSGNALTGPEVDRAAESMMRANPAFRDLVRQTQGMSPDELEANEKAGRDRIRVGEAQAQVALRGQLQQIGEDAAGKLIPAIREMVDAGVREAIRQLREPMLAQQIAARQEGR